MLEGTPTRAYDYGSVFSVFFNKKIWHLLGSLLVLDKNSAFIRVYVEDMGHGRRIYQPPRNMRITQIL